MPRRVEIRGVWRLLRNEELHGFHSSPGIIQVLNWRMRLAVILHVWKEENDTYRLLSGKTVRRKLIVRPRNRWKDNIKIDIKQKGGQVVDWLRIGKSDGLL